MYMSDDEIRASYRTAADQKSQIKVLAELNACSAADMREKLTELGFSVGEPRKKTGGRVKLTIDELRAMELYDEGLTDLQIAETLGVPEYKIGGWRRMMRLKKNAAAAPDAADDIQDPAAGIVEEAEQMPECRDSEYKEQRMSAWALLEILQRLTSAYPDREVSIRTEGGAGILRAAIKVEYGAEAEIASVGVELCTEY